MLEEVGEGASSEKCRFVEDRIEYDAGARLLSGICCPSEIKVTPVRCMGCHSFIAICGSTMWVSESAGSDALSCLLCKVPKHLFFDQRKILVSRKV